MWSRARHKSPDNNREDISKKNWGFSPSSGGNVGPWTLVLHQSPVSQEERLYMTRHCHLEAAGCKCFRTQLLVTWLTSTFLNFQYSKQTDWFAVLAPSFCRVAIWNWLIGCNEWKRRVKSFWAQHIWLKLLWLQRQNIADKRSRSCQVWHTPARNEILTWRYGWCHILDSSEISSQKIKRAFSTIRFYISDSNYSNFYLTISPLQHLT